MTGWRQALPGRHAGRKMPAEVNALTAIEMVERNEVGQSQVARSLAPYETVEAWPAGRVLFREGEEPAGVYFLHSGEVDLCFATGKSEPRSLLVADAGQILGITCVMSGRKHDCTATTRSACMTGFVEKEKFLRLLDEQPALWLSVLQMISTNINQCWDCMRSIAAAR